MPSFPRSLPHRTPEDRCADRSEAVTHPAVLPLKGLSTSWSQSSPVITAFKKDRASRTGSGLLLCSYTTSLSYPKKESGAGPCVRSDVMGGL